MAKKPDGYVKLSSLNPNYFSADGSVNTDPQAVLTLYDEINKRSTEATNKILSNKEMLASIMEEQIEKEQKAARLEAKHKKEMTKLELALIKAQADNDKKHEKALEKEIKVLRERQKLEKQIADAAKKAEPYLENIEAKENLAKQIKDNQQTGRKLMSDAWKTGNFKEGWTGFKMSLTGGVGGGAALLKGLDTIITGLGDLSKKMDKTIDEIVAYKSDWDTRLFGSGNSYSNLVDAVNGTIGASPFVKQADVMKNINDAIDKGIAYNIEQRAFLQTVKDDIATTFDAFDSTLLSIVRIQQSDSTAARLGMEAALNEYLNSMYSNTEYLKNVSDSVTGALYEATSLMDMTSSIGFEYQAQKWLGSLYSVGMSQGTVSSIATALGQLASGNIAGTTTDAGKLLVMAASRAGLDYSQLLTEGLNDSQMNALMESMVEYLQEIASSNKVVQAQYAKVFGLSTSDIVAATNLSQSISAIANNSLNYGGALGSLNYMAKTIGSRMSLGEMMNNAIGNLQYTIAGNIADNPVMYSLWAITEMLDSYVGGMPLPFISGMGTGVDLETTMADLMRVGVMGAGLLGGIGDLISAGSASGGLGNGIAGILNAFGVGSTTTVRRGQGLGARLTESVSESTVVGNSSGEDVYSANSEMAAEQVAEAKPEDDKRLTDIQENIISIEGMLRQVIIGDHLRVSISPEE